MPNWIENLAEPQRLFLAWQAPDQTGVRYRWAVGELQQTAVNQRVNERQLSLRYFREGPEFEEHNPGKSFDELKRLGYAGYPAFSMTRETHVEGVVQAFMRRLPPRSRPDFSAYREQFRLAASAEVSDTTLLALTEAKLPSDGFSLVDPLSTSSDERDLLLEVAGYRYYASKVGPLMLAGTPVDVYAEDDSAYDPQAVAFSIAGAKLGNLNRLQAATFRSWLSRASVTATVERMNGKPDHPRAFLFIRIRPRHQRAA